MKNKKNLKYLISASRQANISANIFICLNC